MKKIVQKLKPSVPKRHLLLVAGIFWMTGGWILLSKGIRALSIESTHFSYELIGGLGLGCVFYYFMFSRISQKHIKRMFAIEIVNPCLFSFFNIRGYILISIMNITGITLRKTDLVNHEILFTFYVIMGIPLFISSIRFFYFWFKYHDKLESMNKIPD